MHGRDYSIGLILLFIFIPIAVGTTLSQGDPDDGAMLNQLVLNVYIDDAGRALINGYADDPGALAFLNPSEYMYEDDSRQLYAITSALTSKSKDNWTVSFESKGRYDVYRIMLYLPANVKVRQVDCSLGLDDLVYAANESFVAEVQGYDVIDPAIHIEYLLPLAKVPGADADTVTGADARYPSAIVALFILLAAGSGILILLLRSRSASVKPAEPNLSAPIEQRIDAGHQAVPLNKNAEDGSRIPETSEAPWQDKNSKAGIKPTSEIAAVMDTLTDKEQSIMRILLQRGGTMTQTEIRYETDISKSSLSGILTSMEKRNIITKKERGRTNVIELSERFLNAQERS